MLEMAVDSIRASLMNYQRVVILKQKDGDRYLPIWIGPHEADAIAVKLQDVSVSRPMSHDLLEKVIVAMGGALRHIVVTDLQNDTFYAKLTLDANGDSMEVDSRPSDAIALAVRTKVPIYVEETVLETRRPGSRWKRATAAGRSPRRWRRTRSEGCRPSRTSSRGSTWTTWRRAPRPDPRAPVAL